MNKNLLYLEKKDNHFEYSDLDAALSFRPFLDFVRKKAQDEKTIRTKFYQYVLEKFNQFPELEGPIAPERIGQLDAILELVYAVISSPLSDENEELIAFGVPFSPIVFYYSNAWGDLMVNAETGKVKENVEIDKDSYFQKHGLRLIYGLILERFYQFDFNDSDNSIVHTLIDEKNGLPQYFKVVLDERFVDVKLKGELPELNFEIVEQDLKESFDFNVLTRLLPLSLFRFEGFAVISLTDVTPSYAVESIKNSLLERNGCEFQEQITTSLQTLLGSRTIRFGFFPLLKVNNKLIFDSVNCQDSLLFGKAIDSPQSEILCNELLNVYLQNPRMVYFRKVTEELVVKHPHLRLLTENNVRSYAVIPINFNAKVAGLMEVYCNEDGVLDEKTLSRIDPAIPLVSQMMQNLIDEFHARISGVIRDKFTSLQPVVQWKFNEVAWRYIQAEDANGPTKETDKIYFQDVYPLYGAIDVRDSTIQRNAALRMDLQEQFAILIRSLEELKKIVQLDLIDKTLYQTRNWLNHINVVTGQNDQVWLNDFLSNEVNSFLLHIRDNYPGTEEIVSRYFDATNEHNGSAFQNRKKLETSMRMVNEQVSRTLEYLKNDILNQYPFYFEKFRTDGVEYDIYIGQSLVPDKPFSNIYLRNLRLWQLSSMAALTRQTAALKAEMPVPLETTQLLFVHGSPIDISFRNDERRFDVEGAYNIRYQVIKKRIDKVNIHGTQERLTQPGKIAIVYLNKKDADEYLSYIQYLQEQGVLNNDVEQLELEELQGIVGLKALRVGVQFTN